MFSWVLTPVLLSIFSIQWGPLAAVGFIRGILCPHFIPTWFIIIQNPLSNWPYIGIFLLLFSQILIVPCFHRLLDNLFSFTFPFIAARLWNDHFCIRISIRPCALRSPVACSINNRGNGQPVCIKWLC